MWKNYSVVWANTKNSIFITIEGKINYFTLIPIDLRLKKLLWKHIVLIYTLVNSLVVYLYQSRPEIAHFVSYCLIINCVATINDT